MRGVVIANDRLQNPSNTLKLKYFYLVAPKETAKIPLTLIIRSVKTFSADSKIIQPFSLKIEMLCLCVNSINFKHMLPN